MYQTWTTVPSSAVNAGLTTPLIFRSLVPSVYLESSSNSFLTCSGVTLQKDKILKSENLFEFP